MGEKVSFYTLTYNLTGVSIYTNSAHQCVIGVVNTTKDAFLNISSSGVDGKARAF